MKVLFFYPDSRSHLVILNFDEMETGVCKIMENPTRGRYPVPAEPQWVR